MTLPRLSMVLALLVVSSATALTADPVRPAEFKVSNTIVQPDKFLFTATIGGIPTDTIAFGAFEPFVFRTKWELKSDAENELGIPSNDWQAFRMFKDGFWDSARVRVYRIRNGAMVKVRDDRIADGGHCASGWDQVKLGRSWEDLVDPAATRVRLSIGSGWLMDVPYWYRVVPVRKDGTTGPGSAPVSVTPAQGSKGKVNVKIAAGPKIGAQDAALPAPTGVKAELDAEGGLVLTWQPVRIDGLAGYRVEYTDTDPAKHKGFHMRLAGKAGAGGQEALKAGDIAFIFKQFTDYSRRECVSNTMQNARGIGDLMSSQPKTNSFPTFFGDEEPGASWKLVKHPGPLPENFTDPGETCIEMVLDAGKDASILVGRHGRSDQDWYSVLKPNTEYALEARIRTTVRNAQVNFTYSSKAEPLTVHPDNTWKLHRVTFNSGADGSLLGNAIEAINLNLSGPGTFHIDNVRLYPVESGFYSPAALGVTRGREAGLHAVRYHSHIKSGWSYTIDQLTNAPGVVGRRGARDSNNPNTLPALLGFTRDIGANPWLQVEMALSEQEWLALVEYMAAPYDPAVDTPRNKPWAYKRYRQGQQRPWTDEFEKVYFEISNETWNWSFDPWIFYPGHVDEATGRPINRGEVYGLLHSYVMETLRSSPYWTEGIETKWRDVLGGWSSDAGDSQGGYGPNAVLGAPNAYILTEAAYNGGWDAGEQAAEMTDASLFRSATFFMQHEAKARGPMRVREEQVAAGLTPEYAYGTYEAGPGYSLPGRATRKQQEAQDQVGKSLATGIATLDAFVGRALLGHELQNFFTMSFRRNNWTAFQPMRFGGDPYPSWMGLVLFNTEGKGDFLDVTATSMPTADLEKFAKRPERKDAPLVGCYVTSRGDRVNLLVLSRKVDKVLPGNPDGWTPVTVELPFTRSRLVTLHMMTGDPRWHNLDDEKVKIETREGLWVNGGKLTLTRNLTGLAKDGLPPASALLFVFEGTDIKTNSLPQITLQTPVQVTVGKPVTVKASATDPDGDRVKLSWDLDGAGTYDAGTGAITFQRSGRHWVYAVADDGKGGVARKLCLVEASLEAAGHKWAKCDLDNKAADLPAPTARNGRLVIPAREGFRFAQWLYATDVKLGAKGSVTMRLVGEPSDRGNLFGGISLRNTETDWKPYRTSHISLLYTGTNKGSTLTFDDLRGPGGQALETVNDVKLPLWLRIERDGDTFTASASADGHNWEVVGKTDAPRRTMERELLVGIMVGSDRSDVANVTVDNIAIESH